MPAFATNPQVICLGECLIDRIFSFLRQYLCRPFWEDYPGGAPANVAVGLAKLGTPSGFMGCLGSERSRSKYFCRSCQRKKVNCAQVQIHPTAPTRVVFSAARRAGGPTFCRVQPIA